MICSVCQDVVMGGFRCEVCHLSFCSKCKGFFGLCLTCWLAIQEADDEAEARNLSERIES